MSNPRKSGENGGKFRSNRIVRSLGTSASVRDFPQYSARMVVKWSSDRRLLNSIQTALTSVLHRSGHHADEKPLGGGGLTEWYTPSSLNLDFIHNSLTIRRSSNRLAGRLEGAVRQGMGNARPSEVGLFSPSLTCQDAPPDVGWHRRDHRARPQ